MDSLWEASGFCSALAAHRPLIAAHRGTPAGNVTESTRSAFRTAFLSGADICETDLICSSDGVLYCFHDGSEPANFRQSVDIRRLTAREIDALVMYNRLGLPSGCHLDRFEAVLDTFCRGELFNIDRCWPIFSQVFDFLRRHPGQEKRLLFKAPARQEYLDTIRALGCDYLFMPIVYSPEDIARALACPDIHIAGFELIADSPAHALFGPDTCRRIHAGGRFVWVNTLDLSCLPEHILYGGLNDTVSILQGPENGWGKIADFGADVLQTDFPALMKNWRDSREQLQERKDKK